VVTVLAVTGACAPQGWCVGAGEWGCLCVCEGDGSKVVATIVLQ